MTKLETQPDAGQLKRSEQDDKDNEAISKLLRITPVGYDVREVRQVIQGTTISLSLACALVAGFDGEFTFSNGEKRVISHRAWI